MEVGLATFLSIFAYLPYTIQSSSPKIGVNDSKNIDQTMYLLDYVCQHILNWCSSMMQQTL